MNHPRILHYLQHQWRRRKNYYTGENRVDFEKGGSSAERIRIICKLNFLSLEEIFRISISNKFEEPKLLCQVQPLQNRRFVPFERAPQIRRLSLQIEFKGRVFFSTSSPSLAEVCKIPVETEVVPISLPLLWIGFNTQHVYKTHGSFNCYTKKIRYATDFILQ